MANIQSIPGREDTMEVKLGDIQSNLIYHSPLQFIQQPISSTTNENLARTTYMNMTTLTEKVRKTKQALSLLVSSEIIQIDRERERYI